MPTEKPCPSHLADTPLSYLLALDFGVLLFVGDKSLESFCGSYGEMYQYLIGFKVCDAAVQTCGSQRRYRSGTLS